MGSVRIGIILLLVSGFFTACQDQEKSFGEKDVAAIEDVMMQQQEAWNNGDLEAFMQGYWHSDSVKFIGKNGVVYGWDNMLGNYRNGYPDQAAMGQLTFTLKHIDGLGSDQAAVTGKWELNETEKKASGHFLLLFRLIDGEWKIITDCTS